MLISKASFNVNTLVVVVVHFTVTLSQQREHWIPYALCNKFRNLFQEQRANVFKVQISIAIFIFCRFSSKSKTILPCLFTLLSSAVAFSSCNTHTNPLLWSFLSQQSLLFDEGNWPAAAVACILLLFFLSSSMRVFVQTRTHWKTPVGADCCCFVGLQNSHFYLETALHTTSESRNILSCLFHSSRDDTDNKKNRTGLGDRFSPIPENKYIARWSRPDVDFAVSRSCFLLTAAVAFPLLCWIISGCSSTARGPFTFTKEKPFHSQTNAHTNTWELRDCLLISLSLSLLTRE